MLQQILLKVRWNVIKGVPEERNVFTKILRVDPADLQQGDVSEMVALEKDELRPGAQLTQKTAAARNCVIRPTNTDEPRPMNQLGAIKSGANVSVTTT